MSTCLVQRFCKRTKSNKHCCIELRVISTIFHMARGSDRALGARRQAERGLSCINAFYTKPYVQEKIFFYEIIILNSLRKSIVIKAVYYIKPTGFFFNMCQSRHIFMKRLIQHFYCVYGQQHAFVSSLILSFKGTFLIKIIKECFKSTQ